MRYLVRGFQQTEKRRDETLDCIRMLYSRPRNRGCGLAEPG